MLSWFARNYTLYTDATTTTGVTALVGLLGTLASIFGASLALLIFRYQRDDLARGLQKQTETVAALQKTLAAEADPISPRDAIRRLGIWFQENKVEEFIYASSTSAIPLFWHDRNSAHDAVSILTSPSSENTKRKIYGPSPDSISTFCEACASDWQKDAVDIKSDYEDKVKQLSKSHAEVEVLKTDLNGGYAYVKLTTQPTSPREELIIFAPPHKKSGGTQGTPAEQLKDQPDIFYTSNNVMIRLVLAIR